MSFLTDVFAFVAYAAAILAIIAYCDARAARQLKILGIVAGKILFWPALLAFMYYFPAIWMILCGGMIVVCLYIETRDNFDRRK